MRNRPPFSWVLRMLKEQHGTAPAPPSRDPFALVLWEQVGYLVDDERRAAALALLAKRTKLDPARILREPDVSLLEIARLGGSVGIERRAERLRASARLLLELGVDADALARAPLDEARRAFQKFDSIGAPGAMKILFFARAHASLPLESNGLRVLARFGVAREEKSYEATYRAVQAAIADELPAGFEALEEAHLLLRAHGQLVCKRTSPRCDACALAERCAFRSSSTSP